MRGHRAHSAFMQLFGFLSLAARYAAIPADFIYNKGYKRGFHWVLAVRTWGQNGILVLNKPSLSRL